MSRRAFTYTELLCVIGIAAVIWMLLIPGLVRGRNRADETACTGNLRNVSWALGMYAQDHNGWLPPALTGLSPRYLHDPDVYCCPRVESALARFPDEPSPVPAGAPHYAYRPGLAHDDLPQEAVAWDRGPWHRGGANVLYLSGAVEHMGEAQLDHLNHLPGPQWAGAGP